MFKIFVGNLSATTTEDALRRLFGRYAEVDDIAIPIDTETGKSRGFAIVMIKDEIRAKSAMIALRGTRLDGRALVINQARKKGEKPPPKRDRRSSNRYKARGRPMGSRSGGAPYSGGGRASGGYGGSGGGFGSRPGGYGGRGESRPGGSSGGGGFRRDRDDRGPGPSGPGFGPKPKPRDDE